MKRNNGIFRSLMAFTFTAVVAIAGQSCNNETTTDEVKPVDTKKEAEATNDAKMTTDSAENDADFLVAAAEINLEEIQLGQLAEKNGSMKHVKELGKMMETDHSKALTDLKALAAKKNITIPTSITADGQKAYDKLSTDKGKDFDKSFADKMVDGHKGAIDKFEKASEKAKDADIKAWAASMLPSLKTHLEHSEMVQEECKKM